MPKALDDMFLFSLVENGQAIIADRGVYQQVDLYKRGDQLFAAYGKGFIRLLASFYTTKSNVKWSAIEGVRYEEKYDGPKEIGPVAGQLRIAK